MTPILTPQAAADYLAQRGFPTTPKALNARRQRSPGNPAFHRVGRRVAYKPADLDAFLGLTEQGGP